MGGRGIDLMLWPAIFSLACVIACFSPKSLK